MEVVPSIWSLLGGRFVIAAIRLDGASINLTKSGPASEWGRWNFSSIVNPSVIRTAPAIHVRDSRVWRVPQGTAVAWTRMGEGNVDIERYIRSYAAKCPGRAVSLELIMHRQRAFDYHDPEFWSAYRSTPAWEFARFLTLAERGSPRPDADASVAETIEDVDVSLKWLRGVLET